MNAQSTQTQTSRFAIVGEDGVYLDDGTRMPRPVFQQLGYWLDAMTRRSVETLWLHPSCGWRWRDADIDGCAEWIIAGSGGGEVGGIEIGEPWWTATRPGTYGVRDIVQPLYEDRAPWRSTPDAPTLRRALLAFRDALGMDWRRSPGATGLRLLRRLHSGPHATRLECDTPPPPATDSLAVDAAHLNWTRALREHERGGYLHSFDVNGQYLAACSSLPLGVGGAEHHTRVTLPAKPSDWLAGYYRVSAREEALGGLAPHILYGEPAWITTPTLRLLRESGAQVRLLEAWTWNTSKRYLEPWYKTLRDARGLLAGRSDPYALDALKGLYRHGIAWFESRKWDRSDDSLYRPDWAQQVRALARANVLRTVYRVGAQYDVWPLAVGSDCVYYVSDSPELDAAPFVTRITGQGMQPTDGVRVSAQLGHYKPKDAGVPVEEIAEYLRGRQWSLHALQVYLNQRSGRRAA